MPLARLTYISENQLDRHAGSILGQLSEILSASNRNNKRLGITGALVFEDMWFLQILEGERRTILETFERLKDDERHAGILLIELRDVSERVFGNWWMGLAKRDQTTQRYFDAFMRKGLLQAEEMNAEQILNLAIQLAKVGLHRDLTVTA